MNIIPITPATIEIIEVLNDGVRPPIEPETVFVFNGKGQPGDIVHEDDLGEIAPEWMAVVKILYRG